MATGSIAATTGFAAPEQIQGTCAATNAANSAGAEARGTTSSAATAASRTGSDRWRDWLWGFLVILAVSQLYFVRELVAAFALFALAFLAIAAMVIGVYVLQKAWEAAVSRLVAWRRPVLQISPVPHDSRKPA